MNELPSRAFCQAFPSPLRLCFWRGWRWPPARPEPPSRRLGRLDRGPVSLVDQDGDVSATRAEGPYRIVYFASPLPESARPTAPDRPGLRRSRRRIRPARPASSRSSSPSTRSAIRPPSSSNMSPPSSAVIGLTGTSEQIAQRRDLRNLLQEGAGGGRSYVMNIADASVRPQRRTDPLLPHEKGAAAISAELARGSDAPFLGEAASRAHAAPMGSLCDGCGKCCLHKLEDEVSGEVHPPTSLPPARRRAAAAGLSRPTRLCSDCIRLTAQRWEAALAPSTCAYRLRAEGKRSRMALSDQRRPRDRSQVGMSRAAGPSPKGRPATLSII